MHSFDLQRLSVGKRSFAWPPLSPLEGYAQWHSQWCHWVYCCMRNTISPHTTAISVEIIHVESSGTLSWAISMQTVVGDASECRNLHSDDHIYLWVTIWTAYDPVPAEPFEWKTPLLFLYIWDVGPQVKSCSVNRWESRFQHLLTVCIDCPAHRSGQLVIIIVLKPSWTLWG